ncbi:SDR family oxidoreductase [Spirillospora sp. NPDC048911]|uniref:SDR family oxidoreductase n=1 Tax=Spirillospora sp. NPDC048911 TaxID=3364527 RepID=UPI003719C593
MSVLITGVTGFLGSRLLSSLLARDEPIVALTNRRSRTSLPALQQVMRAMGCSDERVRAAGRLELVDIELTAPRFGLPARRYDRLVAETTEIWHLAASTNLDPRARGLSRVNVEGTRSILTLASAARHRPRLCHVSTAFVAGRRRQGLVLESDLDRGFGFENPYEESKYQAEVLVRSWAGEHDAPVVILRPSILVSDRPAVPGGPLHPFQSLLGVSSATVAAVAEESQRIPVRLPALPQAHLNLTPVDHAADLMVAVATAHQSPGVRTFHITHPEEVSMSSVVELFESLLPVSLELTSVAPPEPLPIERIFYARGAGFLPYLFHQRRYDREGLVGLGLDTPMPPVSVKYLKSSLAEPAQEIESAQAVGSG